MIAMRIAASFDRLILPAKRTASGSRTRSSRQLRVVIKSKGLTSVGWWGIYNQDVT
jgi:hypothetical protein